MGITPYSIDYIDRMPLGRYEQWHRFLKNHLQRVAVTAKARAKG